MQNGDRFKTARRSWLSQFRTCPCFVPICIFAVSDLSLICNYFYLGIRAVLIEEKDFDFDRMMKLVVEFLNDRERLVRMGNAAKAIAGGNACEEIYKGIMQDFDEGKQE